MKKSDFKYMKEAVVADLALLLSKDLNLNIEDSLSKIYNSETYTKLNDPKTGLFFQSSGYIYSFLKDELSIIS